jgi:predicted acyl esterase
VKLIDVYPDEVVGRPPDGWLPARDRHGDFFRGRYREGLAKAVPSRPTRRSITSSPCRNVNHVFLPGHRIMVQVQSSWFPLYDRNPQQFVPNIFLAKPGDYAKATQSNHGLG